MILGNGSSQYVHLVRRKGDEAERTVRDIYRTDSKRVIFEIASASTAQSRLLFTVR
jgi:hypothetical protein